MRRPAFWPVIDVRPGNHGQPSSGRDRLTRFRSRSGSMVSVARPWFNAGCHVDGGSVRGSPPFPGKDTEIPRPRLDRHCRRPVSVYARLRRGPRESGSDCLDPGNRLFPRDMGVSATGVSCGGHVTDRLSIAPCSERLGQVSSRRAGQRSRTPGQASRISPRPFGIETLDSSLSEPYCRHDPLP